MDKALANYDKLDHDLGFLWHLMSGASYKITGDKNSKIRNYFAANVLSSRYVMDGGFIRAWNSKQGENWSIIDCLMNLPLLYWASEEIGDDRFKRVAMAHADMSLIDHLRDDGSINHICEHDRETGELVTTHAGQECDIVIKGRLKVQVGEHTEILEEGDSIYYDSSTPHGMIAIGGEDCYFYAIVLLPDENQDENKIVTLEATPAKKRDTETRVYSKFITTEEDENGAPISINYKGENSFNFAYDVVDTLGKTKPDKLAIMHVAEDGTESKITFSQVKRASALR